MGEEFGGGIKAVRGEGPRGLMLQPLKLTTFLRAVMKSPPPTPRPAGAGDGWRRAVLMRARVHVTPRPPYLLRRRLVRGKTDTRNIPCVTVQRRTAHGCDGATRLGSVRRASVHVPACSVGERRLR